MASIQKRPNGRWRARYVDPSGKERSQHFPTKVDAQNFLATQSVRLRDGSWVDPLAGRRTFGEYAKTWMAAQVHLRQSSKDKKQAILRQQLLPAFEHTPLSAMRRVDVQQWASSRTGRGGGTVKVDYQLLRQIMRAAVDDRLIGSSPCWRINLPEHDTEITIPTTDQVAAVMAKAPARAQMLIEFTALTGLRISEVIGLTVDRVDFLRRTVTVDRQTLGVKAGLVRFGPAKTKASKRVIPIPVDLAEHLAAYLTEYPSSGVLFANGAGTPWTRNHLGKEWVRWRTAAEVTFKFHDLRHFYASALISAGQSVKVVQKRLGHASAATTLDVYGHLWPDDEDATRTIISGLGVKLRRTADGPLARIPRSGA